MRGWVRGIGGHGQLEFPFGFLPVPVVILCDQRQRGNVFAVLGPVLLWTTRREEKRLARGKTYEPPTILERSNWVEA